MCSFESLLPVTFSLGPFLTTYLKLQNLLLFVITLPCSTSLLKPITIWHIVYFPFFILFIIWPNPIMLASQSQGIFFFFHSCSQILETVFGIKKKKKKKTFIQLFVK